LKNKNNKKLKALLHKFKHIVENSGVEKDGGIIPSIS
jgi:hypothetical protein